MNSFPWRKFTAVSFYYCLVHYCLQLFVTRARLFLLLAISPHVFSRLVSIPIKYHRGLQSRWMRSRTRRFLREKSDCKQSITGASPGRRTADISSSPSSVESKLDRTGESEMAESFPSASCFLLSLASLDFLARVTILRDCSQSSIINIPYCAEDVNYLLIGQVICDRTLPLSDCVLVPLVRP